MRIAHAADLHVRLYKRHAEYERVLDTFVDSLFGNKVDRVVLAGDLFHNKTTISPEAYVLMRKFLQRLGSYGWPVDIITGNHDCIINQSGRMDAIEPIVSGFNSSSDFITQYNKSGIYDVSPKLSYGVYSLLDKDNFPVTFKKDPSRIYVALYHGAMNLSKTDVGFVMNTSDGIDMFGNYDIVMLGDIHKMQYVRYRKDGTPTAAYSGSLIQQNFGESVDKGYIIWDINDENISSRFVRVHNDYGFYTVNMTSTSSKYIEGLDFSDAPKRPYVRVIVDTDDYNILTAKNISNIIKEKLNPLSISIETNIDNTPNGIDIKDLEIENVSNVNVQQSMIEKFAKKLETSDEDIEGILKIHKELFLDTSDDYFGKRCLNWNVNSFKFDNTFSYGEDNYIDFDNLQGLVGIFSPNASGKSSIMDAFLMGIFNRCSRASRNSVVDIINKAESSALMEIDFNTDSGQYLIRRVVKRRVNDPNRAANEVNIFKIENGEEINITGDRMKNDTEIFIRSILGEYDNHKIASFGLQNALSNFIDMKQSERKEYLSSFIGIDIIEQLHLSIGEECKALKTLISQYKKHDYRHIHRTLKARLISNNSDLREFENERDSKTEELNKIRELITKQQSSIRDIENGDVDIDSLNENVESMRKLRDQYLSSKDELVEAVQNSKNRIEKLKTEIAEYDVTIEQAKEINDDINAKLLQVKSLESERNLLNEKIRNRRSQIKILDDHDWFEKSEYCKKCNFLSQAFEAKEDIPFVLGEKETVDEEIDSLNFEVSSNSGAADTYNALMSMHEDLNGVISGLEIKELKVSKINRDIKIVESKIEAAVKNIEDYEKNKQAININNESKKEIGRLQSIEKDKKIEYSSISRNIEKLKVEIGSITQKINDLSDSIDSLSEIETSYRRYSILRNILSKNGIQFSIVKKVIPRINIEINKMLSNIPDFEIVLEIDDESKYLDIFIEDSVNKRRIELGSGMEKTLAAIAIRAALANISLLPKSNLFVVDEGFAPLDAENLSLMDELLLRLKSMFRTVIIISHIDSMQDICDHIITVEKDSEGYSKLKIS